MDYDYGKNSSNFVNDNLPVKNVSWDDVQEFIEKLNILTDRQYRLPSEVEWEFAARGGNKSKGLKYSGNNTLSDVAWYEDNSNRRTHLVGCKKSNELGIYDMSGNVWEWCSNWYDKYRSNVNVQSNPEVTLSGSNRVSRGGGWNSTSLYSRVTWRNLGNPDYGLSNIGFRLVHP